MNLFQVIQNKRLKFFVVSASLTGLLVFLSFPSYQELAWLLLLPVATVLLTHFALGRSSGIEVFTLHLLPMALALGAVFNQYSFPNFSSLVKILIWFSFFFIFYTLLLALNVFRVERLKGEKIPLEKAARPVVFLLSFLVAFLLLTVIYKFELGVLLTTIFIFLLGFVLSLNFFWFFTLTDLFERSHFLGAAAVGVGIVQISLAFSFFPWKTHLRGLSEAVFFYAILGVVRAYFEKHLKYAIVLEYILLSLGVFLFVRFF